MNRSLTTALLGLASLLAVAHADAQIAGSTIVGVETTTVEVVTAGWSVKKQVIGKTVYNGDGESVGKIDDLIIAPGSAVSTVIVGAGGFVGLKRHQVAIPVAQLQENDGTFVLPGATKAAIKALPAFEYAKPAPARPNPVAAHADASKAESVSQ
jgi:hypothetical protein